MGHNTDLAPESKIGSGIVWLRTNATEVTTVFDLAAGGNTSHGHDEYQSTSTPAAAPSMTVDSIDAETLEVVASTQCEPASGGAKQKGWRVTCSLLHNDTSGTFAVRFRAPKALVLRSSTFA